MRITVDVTVVKYHLGIHLTNLVAHVVYINSLLLEILYVIDMGTRTILHDWIIIIFYKKYQ